MQVVLYNGHKMLLVLVIVVIVVVILLLKQLMPITTANEKTLETRASLKMSERPLCPVVQLFNSVSLWK